MPKSLWKEREDFELLWRRNGEEGRAGGCPWVVGGGRGPQECWRMLRGEQAGLKMCLLSQRKGSEGQRGSLECGGRRAGIAPTSPVRSSQMTARGSRSEAPCPGPSWSQESGGRCQPGTWPSSCPHWCRGSRLCHAAPPPPSSRTMSPYTMPQPFILWDSSLLPTPSP